MKIFKKMFNFIFAMRSDFLFLTASLIFSIHIKAIAAIGGDVGNGGDAVYCQSSNNNPFSGYYSLDYLVQYQNSDDLVAANSLESSLVRIENLFKKNIPELYESFLLFHKNILNTTDTTQVHLWEKAPFGLVDLKDEKLVNLIPANCLNNGNISIVQAAIRVNSNLSGRPLGFYLYKYVPEVLQNLKMTNPVQASFLIVHEWLWQHSSSVDRNRRVNYWLHSKIFEKSSREDSLKYLAGLGFVVPSQSPPLFSAESCLPDSEEYKHLIDFSEKRFILNSPFELGRGRFFYRKHSCDSTTSTCDKYDYFDSNSVLSRNFFDQSVFVILDKDLIKVSSGVSIQSAQQHFECKIDFLNRKIQSCSQFIAPNGKPYTPAFSFNLSVGSGCLRLSSSRLDKESETTYSESEKVLFVKTVAF